MKILGIVAPLSSEARCLTNQPMRAGGLVQLPGGTLLKVAGIGAEQALAAAELLIAEGATALLSWGSAGGLAASLLPGNLILPKNIISSEQSVFPVDLDWHDRLCRLLQGQIEFHTQPLAESTAILSTPAEKRELFKQSGAIAVDMESAAVAKMASDAQVPFIAIRAVADPLDMAIPSSALNAIDENGRVQPLKLLHGLVRNPAELFFLIPLRRNFNNARGTLVTVARLAGDSRFAL